MVYAIQVVTIILAILAVPLIIGWIIFELINRKDIARVDAIPNMPLVENDYRSQFTEGYTRGILKRIKANKNNTYLIEFYTSDNQEGEHLKRPEIQSFIVHKDFVRTLPRGDLSSRRDIIKTLTRDPTLIPDKIKGTHEYDYQTKEGQLAFLKSVFSKAIPSGDEAIVEMMEGWSRAGMSKAVIAQMKEMVEEVKFVQNQTKEDNEK